MNAFHNILALLLFSLVCLLPILTVSTARSTTGPPADYFPIPKPRNLQGAWIPRSHGREASALSSRFSTDSLRQRTPPGFTPTVVRMRMIKFTRAGLITPVVTAAKALEDFYSSIAIRAAGVWQTEPQSDSLSIEDGPFRLTFASIGDTIPWDVVKNMADRLWHCAALGFSDLFDAIYMDDTGQVAVSISLRLTDGSSSSSDTGSQFREGSVPSVISPSD